jgi:hypothetical protein
MWIVLVFGAFSAQGVTLSVPSGSGKITQENHDIQIFLNNTEPIKALQFKVADIPDFLSPDTVMTTERTEGFGVATQDTLGYLTIVLFSWTGAVVDSGSGPVLTIRYHLAPEAQIDQELTLDIPKEDLAIVPKRDDGSNRPYDDSEVTVIGGQFLITSVHDKGRSAPVRYSLGQNFPNPFNPETTIPFSLRRSGWAKIEIFNTLGQRVRTLVNYGMPSGSHTARWDGRSDGGKRVSAGLYFYRLETRDFVQTRQLLLLP